MYISWRLWCAVLCSSVFLAACGGGGGGSGESLPGKQLTYTLGGNVTGLPSGASITLLDTHTSSTTADSFTVTGTADGAAVPFVFATPLVINEGYKVTVSAGPSGQTCSVNSAGVGTQSTGTPITNIAVHCATTAYTVGGVVSGLFNGAAITLLNNGVDPLVVTNANNGTFIFATSLASGTPYAVTIGTQPSGQTCGFAGGSATQTGVASANVANIAVLCAPVYAIGGTISGLTASGLRLANTLNSDIASPAANATQFAFPTALITGTAYNVTVQAQPAGLKCTINNSASVSGSVGTAPVSVAVSCVPTYSIGGTISGLTAGGLKLGSTANADTVFPSANDTQFIFPTALVTGAAYNVTVQTQPTGLQCTINNSASVSGSVSNAPISVAVICVSIQAPTFSIGGTITGLTSTGLKLGNINNGDTVSPAASATQFTFPTALLTGATYNVTVQTQPAGLQCTVNNSVSVSGSVASVPISVTVSCVTAQAPTYSVGGTISGLTVSGLRLANSNGDTLLPAANATQFVFPTALVTGAVYNVTVPTQPAGFVCTISNGSGTMGTAPVLVAVNCVQLYAIGGTLSGLTMSGLKLANTLNSDTALPAANATQFAFPTALATGTAYNVTVQTQPAGLKCMINNGSSISGSVGTAPVSVAVGCVPTYSIGGTISGLTASGLRLGNTLNGDTASPAANATQFAFPTALVTGATYNVTVQTQPTGLVCTINNSGSVSGSVGVASVNIAVSCVRPTYKIGGTVSGLAGTGLVLLNSDGDSLAIAGNGRFDFLTAINDGANYAVTVLTQPSNLTQYCAVTTGSGTIANADITNIVVTCTTSSFKIGGTISGLLGSGLVLQNSNGDDKAISGNGSFAFATAIVSGGHYAITKLADPSTPRQSCSLTNTTGTVTSGDITDVVVNCTTNSYAIGGTVNGLATTSTGLTLRRDSGVLASEQTVIAPASNPLSFGFATNLLSGASYTISKVAEPDDRLCVFANGSNTTSGTVGNGPVTDIVVNCTPVGTLAVIGVTAAGSALTNNAVNVKLDSQLQIAFSASLNAATVNGSTVLLTTPYGSHPATVSVSGNTVTVQPTGKLIPGVAYTLSITSNVRGTIKERLANAVTLNFTTSNGWDVAQVFGPTGNMGINYLPQIGFAANGDAYAISDSVDQGPPNCNEFYCLTPNDFVLHSKRFSATSRQWSVDQPLVYLESIIPFTEPHLAVDATGNALVVWALGGAIIDRRYSVNAGTWSAELATAANALVGNASMVMDAGGNAWLVTYEGDGTTNAVHRRLFTANAGDWVNSTWSSVAPFSNSADGYAPKVSMGANGEAAITWELGNTTGHPTFASNLPLGGGAWSAPTAIMPVSANNSVTSSALASAQDGSGSATLVWAQGSGTNVDDSIYAAQYRSGAGWDVQPQLLELLPGNAQTPQVTFTKDGTATAVWSQHDGTAYSIYAARLVAGLWTTPRLLENTNGDAITPQLSADQYGNVIAVWVQTVGSNSYVYASRYTASANVWGTPYQLEGLTGIASFATVSVDRNGNAFAMWAKGTSVYVSRFE